MLSSVIPLVFGRAWLRPRSPDPWPSICLFVGGRLKHEGHSVELTTVVNKIDLVARIAEAVTILQENIDALTTISTIYAGEIQQTL